MGQPIIGASVSLRSPECHGVGALLAARSDGKPATIPTIIKKWPPSRRNGGRLRLGMGGRLHVGMVAAFASEWVAGFARNPQPSRSLTLADHHSRAAPLYLVDLRLLGRIGAKSAKSNRT